MPDTPSFSRDSTPWPLIAAYCTGQLRDADRQELDAWLAADTGHAAEFQALVQAWNGIQPPSKPQGDTQALWANVARKTVHAIPERRNPSKLPRRSGLLRPWKRLVGVAAAGVAAAGVVAILLVWGGANVFPSMNPANAARQSVSHVTGVGERTRFNMPDGTVVQLAPQSEIRYATDFAQNRVVELDGEAVFTVTHLSGTPFIVESHGTRATVLGTTFSVRGYAADTVVRIAVAEGRVQVNESAVLALGDVSSVRPGEAPVVQRGIDVIRLFGWTQGRLVFDHTPLSAAVRDLERWYGITVTVNTPALAKRPVTAEFEDMPATAVLDVLADILQVTYVRTGNHVTFIAKGDRS